MTVLGLIRHGVTDWNVQRKAQGHTDIPLNEDGLQQAQRLADRMQHESWDVIYSSDLGRAYVTAQSVADRLSLTVIQEPLLREKFCGQIEGTTPEDRLAKWGVDWAKLELDIESNDKVAERGQSILNIIAERHPGERILIVSHGGLIGSTIRKLVPELNVQGPLDNTSVTIVAKNPQGWTCELFNCTKHLNV
ncbi:histidine phosphatase family protein [Paenibacillus koleovorans]|uniref:histidine phosphatase family protein n=1 Tax=Paenibacillus koleovorans TaxID=121608 RepID=UPI000FDBBD01|nr:histidine phosphatase family protein [Paenibacillus koleovorans]